MILDYTCAWMDIGAAFVSCHLLQIAVSNVFVRQGLLLLCPENVVVLGGKVQLFEEARQRVMDRWNQPPRGRRYVK